MQRLQPPGHSEVIRLDRTSYLLGRSHKCDVLLYSPMASREHARLTFRDGAWYVQPLGGKTVIADGVKVGDEQRLSHKTRLQLGGDELLYFDERAVAAVPEPRRVAPAASSRRPAILAAAGAAIAALALAAWWMFR
jgi:pSer/pThr/pTyr-binding forkhead associated (FHA) protein